MSEPSSDGRPSLSSDRSMTSSQTLLSRNSASYVNNGEGSSSPRRSLNSRPNPTLDNTATRPTSFPSYTAPGEDNQQRKHRARRSGGFLLDSFTDQTRSRRDNVIVPGTDTKGKRTSKHRENGEKERGKESRHKVAQPGSSPLSQDAFEDEHIAPEQGRPKHHEDRGADEIHVAKREDRAAPAIAFYEPPRPQHAPAAAIDPNQLVHMALNLSESRRRNISANHLLASQSRVVSGSHREGSFSGQGPSGSLRQYFNEQRRASRNLSPMGKPSPARRMSTMQRSGSLAFPGPRAQEPSPATVARVEKARAYIELRVEYFRMLDHLPPLKPNANAPGNFVFTANSMPGSPQAQLTRVPSYAGKQYALGRDYNPLQYIRNRRTRARERQHLEREPEAFLDVDQVREWVDLIEEHARRPGYRREDSVQLPPFHAEHVATDLPSKPSRPHMGWLFTVEELFADTHWLEQGDNKALIENRFGRKIFPPKEVVQRPDFLQPRLSKEYPEKRRRSWVEGPPGANADEDDSDKDSDRGRKRRLLSALRNESPKGGRHSRRHSRLRNKEESESSDSDDDSTKRVSKLDPDHNTGPLALLLEKQAKNHKDAPAKLTPIISPDTPDKWGRTDIGFTDAQVDRISSQFPQNSNGAAHGQDRDSLKIPPKAYAQMKDENHDPRSSVEGGDSTAPSSPMIQRRFSEELDDRIEPLSRVGSTNKKSKRNKLNNFFHSQDHRETNNKHRHEERPGSAGTDRFQDLQKHSEDESDERHLGATILAAPGAVRNLLGHRKNDSVSSLKDYEKSNRRDIQEPPSAVSRFFKGVKQERSKVGDLIFRRDRPDDSDAELHSDGGHSTDASAKATAAMARPRRPAMDRMATAESISSIQEASSHLALPTFRSLQDKSDHQHDDTEHHITRQNRERKNDRSPRFNRLAPPRMDLGAVSGDESNSSLNPTRSHSQDRINKALARPGQVAIGSHMLPVTGMRHVEQDRNRSTSRPTLEGKRHWSIADDSDNKLKRRAVNAVSQADIARVRALFLCSGVKAKTLTHRAFTPRSPPPDFLVRAAATAKKELYPVSRKEEHVLAARILVTDLESSTNALQFSLEKFRDTAVKELTAQLATLHSSVDADLMPRVLDSGDKAVRLTSEVAGQGPLQVKEICDEIDRMLRARRRRMRWLRGFGWMLVEWGLVALMWWLWLTVVVLSAVKRVFGFMVGIVRWLLWL